MSFIDTTYFINDIHIPKEEKPLVRDIFAKSITRYEDEILGKLLGFKLLDTLKNNSDNDPYKSLLNGAEFSFEFKGRIVSTEWKGLINEDLISLISYYVYYKHRRNFDTNYSGIGEVKSKGENSKIISPIIKLNSSYNKMIDLYGEIPLCYFKWGGYFLDKSNYDHYNEKPSAYNYLLANESDFPDWVFTPIRKINPFNV